MKQVLICCVAVCVLLTAMALPASADEPLGVGVITTSMTSFPWPKTDGSWIVWHDAGPNGTSGQILAARTSAPATKPIVVAELRDPRLESRAYAWDIQNDVVIWTDFRDEAWAVYAKRLPQGPEMTIGTGQYPATDGERVVWVEGNAIRSRTLASSAVTTVATIPEPRFVQQLAVHGSRVVWFELTNHAWRLQTQIGDESPTTLHEGAGWVYGYDFSANLVVYATQEGSVRTIFAHDFTNGTRTTIATSGDSIQGPTTDGRYIVWEHIQPNGHQIDLLGYDMQTASHFEISTFRGANTSADLKQNVITWSRDQGTVSEIIVGRLDSILPSGTRPIPLPMDGVRYIQESGHALQGHFGAFWEQRGGLPIFGFPLTTEFDEFNHDRQAFLDTQYLERQRFEYHPENSGTPYEVQLGLLGKDVLRAQGRNWEEFPKANPSSDHYFPETGHAVAPQFWDYWKDHGLEFGDAGVSHREALALWGYPISEPQMETNPDGDTVLTQWFERARFEYHPDNPAAFKVLLGRLGDEMLSVRGW